MLSIQVIDEGVGLSEDTQSKISRILQSDGPGKDVNPLNTDAGLASRANDETQLLRCIGLCKSIVEMNSGSVQFYVNEGNRGNTF